VDSRLEHAELLRVADPLGRSDDPFAAFREVLRLERSLTVTTRHSLGKTSRFFVALAAGQLLASRCPRCGSVWLPPRAVCPTDLSVTTWTELSGAGTLVSWTSPAAQPSSAQPAPPLLAYLALDGASTLFLHRLRTADPGALHHGLPVGIVYATEPVDHPLELCWFEPA
jgi:uncharacterized OB-fold protein